MRPWNERTISDWSEIILTYKNKHSLSKELEIELKSQLNRLDSIINTKNDMWIEACNKILNDLVIKNNLIDPDNK